LPQLMDCSQFCNIFNLIKNKVGYADIISKNCWILL
jgi:hypothetical protein